MLKKHLMTARKMSKVDINRVRNNEEHAPRGYWFNKENQRQFLKQIARDFDVCTPGDWGKIPVQKVIDKGGSFLVNHYNGSLYKALKELFPGIFSLFMTFRT